MVQISQTVTDVDPLVLMSDLVDDESDVSILIENVRGSVIIDMGGDDYTMTDTEAKAAYKVILDAGDGTKILTIPTSSDGVVPSNFTIVTYFASDTFFLASETGGGSLEILSPSIDLVSYKEGTMSFSFYAGNVSEVPYDATWEDSKLIPTQGALFDALSEITDIDADVESLNLNVRDVVGIDMAADNYTMTYDQSLSGVLLPSDVGNGTKILTYPISSQGDIPSVVTVNNLGNSNGFFIEFEAYIGVSLYVPPASIFSFISVDNPVENNNPIQIRSRSNGVITLAAGNTNLSDSDAGKLLIAADAVAQTLTVNTGLLTPNMVLEVSCTGAGGMTITAGTATVTGNAVLAATESCKIYRDALTDNYHCV